MNVVRQHIQKRSEKDRIRRHLSVAQRLATKCVQHERLKQPAVKCSEVPLELQQCSSEEPLHCQSAMPGMLFTPLLSRPMECMGGYDGNLK